MASQRANATVVTGQRRCPNPKCHRHIFFVRLPTGEVRLYPPERIDFDPTDIPPNIVSIVEEAITCYSEGCYIAAAIMVRRTLEELCEDQGATGSNLHQRLQALRSKLVLPQELLDAMVELRVLGNDAAHVNAKVYKNIGREEVEVALTFTKEILKAVYQYKGLLGKLQKLKGQQ